MANLDKERLLTELRNSTQNPRVVELVIHQLEAGEFDVVAPEAKPETKPKKGKAAAGGE